MIGIVSSVPTIAIGTSEPPPASPCRRNRPVRTVRGGIDRRTALSCLGTFRKHEQQLAVVAQQPQGVVWVGNDPTCPCEQRPEAGTADSRGGAARTPGRSSSRSMPCITKAASMGPPRRGWRPDSAPPRSDPRQMLEAESEPVPVRRPKKRLHLPRSRRSAPHVDAIAVGIDVRPLGLDLHEGRGSRRPWTDVRLRNLTPIHIHDPRRDGALTVARRPAFTARPSSRPSSPRASSFPVTITFQARWSSLWISSNSNDAASALKRPPTTQGRRSA